MRNVWKALATAGIAVALAVGPGVGMVNALIPDLPLPDLPLPNLPLPDLPLPI